MIASKKLKLNSCFMALICCGIIFKCILLSPQIAKIKCYTLPWLFFVSDWVAIDFYCSPENKINFTFLSFFTLYRMGSTSCVAITYNLV